MNLIERIKNILLSPTTEWETIKKEDYMISDLFTKYALKLAAIPALAGLIGFTIFGRAFYNPSFGANLKWAIGMYVMSLIGVIILAYIIDVLAPSFGTKKHLATSMKVVIFAYTAAWVGGIFNLIPALGILGLIAGIYSLFLLYKGLQIVKEVPKEKMLGYFVVIIIASILVYMITGFIMNRMAFGSLQMLSM